VILPDGVRNYMTKFVDDKWMADNNFSGPSALDGTVEVLVTAKPRRQLITVRAEESAAHAIELMREQCISQLPVLSNGQLVGILTEDHLLHFLSSTEAVQESVGSIMERSVPTVELSTPLSSLQGTIMKSGLAIVLDKTRKPIHILTKIDLVEWISKKAP